MAKSSHVVITVVSVKCFMVLCGVCDVDGWWVVGGGCHF